MQIYCRDFMVIEEILVILHLYKYYKNGRNKRFKPILFVPLPCLVTIYACFELQHLDK